MKKLLTTLLMITMVFANSFANNNPEKKDKVYSIDEISFKMDLDEYEAWGVSVIYSADDNTIQLETQNDIQYLQVLNANGELEFQLPIFSNEVTLDLDDFEIGQYQLNLMMDGDEIVSSTFQK